MPGQMIGSVTTGVDLNETAAVDSLAKLKEAVSQTTKEWHIGEVAARSAGDSVEAAKIKYDGLTDAVKNQKIYMQQLAADLQKTNTASEEGQKTFDKYAKQLEASERRLNSLNNQMNKAKTSYEYQTSGIGELNKQLTANDKLMQSQIDLYEKTRNKIGAAKAEVSGLSTSYEKQTEIYKAQVAELARLEKAEGTSSEALIKQKTRVFEASGAMADYRKKLLEARLEVTKLQPFGSGNPLSSGLNGVYRTSEKVTSAMSAGFEKVKNAAMSASFGIVAVGAAAIKGAQLATDLQDSYIKTNNLAVTGGEKVAEVTKNVAQMQKDGAEYSVKYGKSQQEIADGYQELIKRGYTSTEALGAMRSELEASVASGDDFNNVLSVTSQVVDAYGKRTDNAAEMTKNTKEVVNQLAYAADMTATDFQSMGLSMEYVGDSAHSAGFELSETSSAIGILSNHGLEADKAGTGLRKVINSITGALSDQDKGQQDAAKSEAVLGEQIAEHQKKLEEAQDVVTAGGKNTKAATKEIDNQKDAIGKLQDKLDQLQSGGAAKDMLSKLGIKKADLVDANGNLKDLTSIMAVINDKTKGMGTAEKNSVFQQLFGTTGQQAGIILTQNNGELDKLNQKVKDSANGQGYVAQLAQKNMSSVKNELKQFEMAGQAALIMIGQKLLPVLSEAATSMAKAFNSKEGKEGLEEIAQWIADFFQTLVNIVKFIGTHKEEVVDFGKAFAAIWGVKKIGDALAWLGKIKTSLLEIKGIDALSGGLGGGGVTEGLEKGVVKEAEGGAGKAAASEGETVVGSALKGGLVEEGGVALGGISAILPKLLTMVPMLAGAGTAVKVGGELLSNDSTKHKGDTVGGALGGAAAGAAIGSVIPGVGTLAGAALGGLAGSSYGIKIADAVRDWKKESDLKSEKLPVVDFDEKAPTKAMKGFSKDYQDFLDKIKKGSDIDPVDEKSLEKAKKAVSDAYAKMSKDIDGFYGKQEKDSKNQVDILVKEGVITQAEADKLNKGQKDSDDKQKKGQKQTLADMQKATNDYYANVGKEQKRNQGQVAMNEMSHAENLKKIKSGNTTELLKLEKMYGKNSPAYLQEMNKEITQENSDFNRAQQKAKKDHNDKMAALDKDYAKTQDKNQAEMNSEINTATKIAQNKQLDLLDDLKNKKGKLNQKQLIDTLEKADDEYKGVKDKAQKQKDEAVKAANEKYKKTIEAADKERAENGSMSKAQYDEIVKNAKNTRTESVNHANGMYKDTVDKATKMHDETINLANDKADKNVKAAAAEQGETVKQYTKGFTTSRDLINSFIDGVNGVLNFLHKGWGKIGHVSLKGFATGTRGLSTDETALVGEEGFELAHHPSRGIYAIGTNGPEIRNLQAGTSILPHSMSKEFLTMTANLPAHANGVEGFLSDAANWVKSAYKDVTSIISKGPKGVVESIYNGLGLDKLEDDFPSVVTNMAKGSAQTAQDNFVKYLESFFKKAKSDGGGSQGSPSGSGVQRWAGQVKQALAANGLSTSQDMIDRVLRQIATESSGNERAVQGDIGDINNVTGDLAKGLMQTISATFNANKFPGHGDIFNGYDNLLAALNYAKQRYGPDLSFLGNGHGYENGGIISNHGYYEIAEGDRPEMVIPLDPQKKSRATQLLKQATQTISNNNSVNTNSNIETALSQAVNLLAQVLGATKAQTTALMNQPAPIVDEKSFSKGLAPEMSKSLTTFQNSSNRRRGIIN